MQSQIDASPSLVSALEAVEKTICNVSKRGLNTASQRQEFLLNIVKPSQFGLQIQEDRTGQSGILETIPGLRTGEVMTSSSYASLPLLSVTPCETTRTFISRHILSATISMENSTTIHRETPDSGLLIRLLVPISITLVLVILVILFCLHRHKKRRRKRARKLTRNNDTTLSWFEAFELPHAVGTLNTMNELNEPADFSIPMGPLCMNNFAFENYDATLVDSIMEKYSTKRRDFHHKEKRRRSEVYPARHIYNQNFDLESNNKTSNLPPLQHVNPAADFELPGTAKTTDSYKKVKNNFYDYHAKNDD